MLTDERIRELYETATLDADWLGRYQRFIERIAEMSDEELLAPAMQSALWLAQDLVQTTGSVSVESAAKDEELAEALVRLRSTTWPADHEERATAIQAEFDKIMGLVFPRHSRDQPWAQVTRVFAALLPHELHCVVRHSPDWAGCLHALVLPGAREFAVIQAHVLSRARLRDVLGSEADLNEDAKRSVFCWWLYDNRQELVPTMKHDAPLAIPSFAKRGLSMSFNRTYCQRIVEAAEGGRSKSQIRAAIADVNENCKESTRDTIISEVVSLGLLESHDGLLQPSPNGKRFLNETQPDALVESLLVKVFPFAHLLRELASKAMKRQAVYQALRDLYPRWTKDQAQSHSINFAKDLGLVAQSSEGLALTPYGQLWEKRIPKALPFPAATKADEDNDAQEVTPDEPLVWPTLAEMRALFGNDVDGKNLIFSKEQDPIAVIHAAWHCLPDKRFVILSGLSGTGKTKVAEIYARLYCEHLDIDPDEHVALVPVSPDWRDPSGLLGYLNTLREKHSFHVEPALRLLLDASENEALPYFLILDEMNLARVERYFAPFLSAMETGGRIFLHGGKERIDGVPPSLEWPSNLFIAGTVNMDETTYPFSDKVLDRAFTFEFWDVDLKRFFAERDGTDPKVADLLLELYAILEPVRRHFGYRTAREILAFVRMGNDGDQRTMLLDQAIFSKVLPRIRGENSDGLQAALKRAKELCDREGLTRSAKKLADMANLLEHTGLTKFWA